MEVCFEYQGRKDTRSGVVVDWYPHGATFDDSKLQLHVIVVKEPNHIGWWTTYGDMFLAGFEMAHVVNIKVLSTMKRAMK